MPGEVKKVKEACRQTAKKQRKKGITITKVVIPTVMSVVFALTGFVVVKVRQKTFEDDGKLKTYSSFYNDSDILTEESLDSFLKVQGIAYEKENNIEIDDKYNDFDIFEVNELVNKIFENSLDLIKVKIAKATGCRQLDQIQINVKDEELTGITIFLGGRKEKTIDLSNIDPELVHYLTKYEALKKTIDSKTLSVDSAVEDFADVAGLCRELGVLMKELMNDSVTFDKLTGILDVAGEEATPTIPGAPINEDDVITEQPKLGIDLSYCQPYIDYSYVANQFDFVGLRFTDFFVMKRDYGWPTAEYWDSITNWDSVNWEELYERCHKGIDQTLIDHYAGFGDKVLMIYSYTNAYTSNEAKAEAKFLLYSLDKLNIKTVPIIYYDIELARHFNCAESRNNSVQLCLSFCREIADSGYFTGIYTSESYYESLLAADNGSDLTEYTVWVANWKYYGNFDYRDVKRTTKSYKDGASRALNQVTEEAKISGILGADRKPHNTDLNVMDNYLYEALLAAQAALANKHNINR